MSSLFTPVQIGRYTLNNRIVMAPMTRSRADDQGVPSTSAEDYYAQRSGAGLIISEGAFPSPWGKGYPRTPGMHNAAQVVAWQRVTQAVHAKGSKIFLQLMHVGRISHTSLLPNGAAPVAPSAVQAKGQVFTDQGAQDFSMPRALELAEIATVVGEYRQATRLALQAGFDGVELHNGSGYLPEQFLSSSTNQRTDAYGASVAGRARFTLDVLAALCAEAGSDRVGIKLSPEMTFNDINDAHPVETYAYLVDQMKPLKLAYLHVATFKPEPDYHALLRPRFHGAYLIGGGLDAMRAEQLLADGKADAAVFGSLFLANPDLPERFKRGATLNTPDRKTYYSGGTQGYTDYPVLDQ